MIQYGLHQQAALVPQPNRPPEGLPRNGLPLEPVDIRQVLCNRKTRLELGDAGACLNWGQRVQAPQSCIEDDETLCQRRVHLCPAPAERPFAPRVGERLRLSGRWCWRWRRRSGGRRRRRCRGSWCRRCRCGGSGSRRCRCRGDGSRRCRCRGHGGRRRAHGRVIARERCRGWSWRGCWRSCRRCGSRRYGWHGSWRRC